MLYVITLFTSIKRHLYYDLVKIYLFIIHLVLRKFVTSVTTLSKVFAVFFFVKLILKAKSDYFS